MAVPEVVHPDDRSGLALSRDASSIELAHSARGPTARCAAASWGDMMRPLPLFIAVAAVLVGGAVAWTSLRSEPLAGSSGSAATEARITSGRVQRRNVVRGMLIDEVSEQPIASARLRVAAGGLSLDATTDKSGRFEVALPRPDGAEVGLVTGDLLRLVLDEWVVPESRPVDPAVDILDLGTIRARRAVSVRFRVLDGNGAPLAGWSVSAIDAASEFSGQWTQCGITAADGCAEAAQLFAGWWRSRVVGPDGASVDLAAVRVRGLSRSEEPLDLRICGRFAFAGAVRWRSGAPVSGAWVAVVEGLGPVGRDTSRRGVVVLCDAMGRFSTFLARRFDAVVQCGVGGSGVRSEFRVSSSECASLNLILEPPIALRGRVIDSRDGRPVEGATLSIDGRVLCRTDAAGSFTAPYGVERASVSAAGFVDSTVAAAWPTAVVTLRRARSVACRVVAEGRAVGLAEIEAAWSVRDGEFDAVRATCDADGVAVIHVPAHAAVHLTARASGLDGPPFDPLSFAIGSPLEGSVVIAAGEGASGGVTLAMTRARTVQGRLVSAGGDPVPGAVIHGGRADVVTDDAGRFFATHDASESMTLSAEIESVVCASWDVDVTARSALPLDVGDLVVPGPISVSGIVRDSRGVPAAAVVDIVGQRDRRGSLIESSLVWPSPGLRSYAGADGRYTVVVPFCLFGYSVRAVTHDGESGASEFRSAPDSESIRDANVTCASDQRALIWIRDERGAGVSGAYIIALPVDIDPSESLPSTEYAGRVAISDLRGFATVPVSPQGARRIVIRAGGFVDAVVPLDQVNAETRVALERSASLAGLITMPGGAPAAGATVELAPQRSAMQAIRATCDDTGRFALSDVAPGRYLLSGWRDSGGAAMFGIANQPVDVPGSGPLHAELQPSRSIVGRIVDRSGAPLRGSVRVIGASAALSSCCADDGTFKVDGVLGSPSQLSVSWSGSADDARFEDTEVDVPSVGLEPVLVVVDPWRAVEGRIRAAAGVRLEGSVFILGPDGERIVPYVRVSSDGRFRVPACPPGDWRVEFHDELNDLWVPLSATVTPGGPPLDLVASPSESVSGTVVDSSGAAVAGAMVSVEFVGPEPQWGVPGATSDEDGRFVVRGIPPGSRFRLLAESRGATGASAPFSTGDAAPVIEVAVQ